MPNEVSERKTITIRGVDQCIYERALKLARELGLTVGDLINEALKRFIASIESAKRAIEAHLEMLTRSGDIVIISSIDTLIVSKRDLESVSKRVVFKDIRELVFTEDVTEDVFREKVYEIVSVDKVIVPKSLSTLLVASKCRYVHKIVHSD